MNDATMLAALTEAIVKQGYTRAQADKWAALIGDTPEIDGEFIVVRSDADNILARLPLSAFPEWNRHRES